ncbi:MAG: DUF58 domain-containing protein, partial [Rhodothermales bacterium]|nr:DUF58 domain-containing protein [Rhodothermales bacterium]
MLRNLRDLFLAPRLFWCLAGLVVLFVVSHFFEWAGPIARLGFVAIVTLFVADLLLVFGADGVSASRSTPRRLSNGDINTVSVAIENQYRFDSRFSIIDEIPRQFQMRNNRIDVALGSGKDATARYE